MGTHRRVILGLIAAITVFFALRILRREVVRGLAPDFGQRPLLLNLMLELVVTASVVLLLLRQFQFAVAGDTVSHDCSNDPSM